MRDAELLRERLGLLQTVDPYIGRYYSMAWVQKNVLQMDEETIKKMKKEINKEEEQGIGGPTMPPEMQQQQQMLALQQLEAQIAVNASQAKQNEAEALKTTIEAQLKPKEIEAKIMSSVTNNLPTNDQLASQEFDKRVKIAELMLKEADIKNKAKIVELQMHKAKGEQGNIEQDFLSKLNEKMNNNAG